ncbi:hypothetical protein CLU79DRAFT_425288 [Phycomyces nitens]|nr:hypothetical protein CLU79DRAFT_425288 [Phycomyces nitens]
MTHVFLPPRLFWASSTMSHNILGATKKNQACHMKVILNKKEKPPFGDPIIYFLSLMLASILNKAQELNITTPASPQTTITSSILELCHLQNERIELARDLDQKIVFYQKAKTSALNSAYLRATRLQKVITLLEDYSRMRDHGYMHDLWPALSHAIQLVAQDIEIHKALELARNKPFEEAELTEIMDNLTKAYGNYTDKLEMLINATRY